MAPDTSPSCSLSAPARSSWPEDRRYWRYCARIVAASRWPWLSARAIASSYLRGGRAAAARVNVAKPAAAPRRRTPASHLERLVHLDGLVDLALLDEDGLGGERVLAQLAEARADLRRRKGREQGRAWPTRVARCASGRTSSHSSHHPEVAAVAPQALRCHRRNLERLHKGGRRRGGGWLGAVWVPPHTS